MIQKNVEHMQGIRVVEVITFVFTFTILFGCVTGSVIVTGDKKPAINPTVVKIYIDSPVQYETIGIIEASAEVGFSTQKAQDKVINKLKSQAAAIGANGVLLITSGTQSNGMAGFYSNGIFYAATSDNIVAQGKAIYVIQE